MVEDDRYDTRLARLVPLERPLHLDLVAIIGGEEVDAHQEQNDVGVFQLFVNLSTPLLAGQDLSVVPHLDHTLSLEQRQILLEHDPLRVVFRCVAEEDLQRPARAWRLGAFRFRRL